jgi:predicted site-specific integrase-resolvase
MIDTAPLLTYREAADLLHVSPSTARRYAAVGLLDVVRFTPQTHRVREPSVTRLIQHGYSAPDHEEAAPNVA